jgi:DNA-binding IclR family transcriptional regulator
MSGTQSLQRAFAILRAVAHRDRGGARLTDVTAATSLAQPTAHRILNALVAEGLIAQDKTNRRYCLGPLLAELGLSAAPRFEFGDLYRASIDRLAEASGDTVFFSKRSGLDIVCLDRRSGSFPVKAFVLDVGVRRPLGIGGSSLAILAILPVDEARDILTRNAAALETFEPHPIDEVMDDLRRYRERGYVVRDIPNLGVRTLAVAVRDRLDRPVGAFSLSTVADRMMPERQRELAELLHAEAALVEARLRDERAGGA